MPNARGRQPPFAVDGPFRAEEASPTAVIDLPAPAGEAFPLFGPIRETEWEEGFNPTILSSGSDPVREGCVFKTTHAQRGETIWMLIVYDPRERRVEYVRVTPTSDLARIRIQLSSSADRESRAEITYAFTALTEEGNDYVRRFTPEHYCDWIAGWGKAIRHYLSTGECLPES